MPARGPLAIVREYHDQTKHHLSRYARSLGYLDWATQPEPFRSFDPCRRVGLEEPLRAASAPEGGAPWRDVSYDGLFAPVPSRPVVAPGLPGVAVFLRYSLGLSAWKQAGPSRWALRVNASSGNLHPTEGYVCVGPGVAGAGPGVYHYAPDAHALEERCVFDAALAEGGPAAYRRLFWEAGAIGQALYLEAEAAGLRGTGIGCFFDDGVHQLLGISDHTLQSLYHFTVGGPVNDSRLTTLPGCPWDREKR